MGAFSPLLLYWIIFVSSGGDVQECRLSLSFSPWSYRAPKSYSFAAAASAAAASTTAESTVPYSTTTTQACATLSLSLSFSFLFDVCVFSLNVIFNVATTARRLIEEESLFTVAEEYIDCGTQRKMSSKQNGELTVSLLVLYIFQVCSFAI